MTTIEAYVEKLLQDSQQQYQSWLDSSSLRDTPSNEVMSSGAQSTVSADGEGDFDGASRTDIGHQKRRAIL